MIENTTTRRFPRSLREAFPTDHYGVITHYTRRTHTWPIWVLALVGIGVAALGVQRGWW